MINYNYPYTNFRFMHYYVIAYTRCKAPLTAFICICCFLLVLQHTVLYYPQELLLSIACMPYEQTLSSSTSLVTASVAIPSLVEKLLQLGLSPCMLVSSYA